MVREILSKTGSRMCVKVYRLGRKNRVIIYFVNLGAVEKITYIQSEMIIDDYEAKNRDEILRKFKITLRNLGLVQ